jgi:hypothetical protein
MARINLLKIRNGIKSLWTSQASVLEAGEPGYDSTYNILKVGNGASTFDNLPAAVPYTGYNYIINGGFEVNQRAVASVTVNGGYPVDRWMSISLGSTFVASQQAFTLGQTDVPGEPKNYMRYVVTSVANAANRVCVFERVEGVRTLAGKVATLTFYAKVDAAKPIAIEFSQSFGTGGSPSTSVNAINVVKTTLSTTWTKYTIPVTVPSISGKTLGTDNNDNLAVGIWFDAGSDYNTRTNSLGQQSGTFEISNVKLEEGPVATPFVNEGYAVELQKCRRYCRALGGNVVYEDISVPRGAASTIVAHVQIPLFPPMRAIPTIVAPTSYANFMLTDGAGASAALSTNPTVNSGSSPNMLTVTCTVASGLTQYRPYNLITGNQTTDRFIISSEL